MAVLLLRPKHKLHASTETFVKNGVPVAPLALIENQIQLDAAHTLHQAIYTSPTPNIAIVTSTFAADLICQYCETWPSNISLFAVGNSTKARLAPLSTSIHVPNESSSEGLLAMPQLEKVKSRHIVVIKGEGGRDLLQSTFSQRGAHVKELNLYARNPIDEIELDSLWKNTPISCIVATSGEIIQQAFTILDTALLINTPWLVVSERTKLIATALGAKHVYVSPSAYDTDLINHCQQFLEH